MSLLLPIVTLLAAGLLIWFLGGGAFGRAQTQQWIERTRRWPAFYAFLDRRHGNFRAAAHYVEFGGLFLALYWLQDTILQGGFHFRGRPAAIVGVLCAIAALLDELHQLKSGTRQFRRVDFLHSCCGISIAMAAVWTQWALRGFPE